MNCRFGVRKWDRKFQVPLRIDGRRELTEFFGVREKVTVEVGVEAAEEKKNLLLDSLEVRLLPGSRIHFRGRLFRLLPDRISGRSGFGEMRRLLEHLRTAFGHEIPELLQDLSAEDPRCVVSESRPPFRDRVDAAFDQMDRLSGGEDFLERS